MWNDSSVWRSKCTNMATTCWWILSKKQQKNNNNILVICQFHDISFLDWQSSNANTYMQYKVKIKGSGYGSTYIWNTMNAQSHNIWKYMAQFIFIVAINWQLIWIISTLCKCENISYGLTYCTLGAQKDHIIHLVL